MLRAPSGLRTVTKRIVPPVILIVSAVASLAGSATSRADAPDRDVSAKVAARMRAALGTNSPTSTALTPLQPTDAANTGEFGSSVALGFGTAVVGAPGDDRFTGAAYVFADDGRGNWNQQAKLVAADGAFGDGLGSSVALGGNTVLVGMGRSAGAIVFSRRGQTWGTGTRLPVPGLASAVAVSPSGRRTVVGVSGSTSQPENVYVFSHGANGQWTQEAVLAPEAGHGSAPIHFGFSIASAENVIAVGAYGEDDFNGAIYVFVRGAAGTWRQQARIAAPAGTFLFGWSVDISDRRIVVGAEGEDSFSGAAYVYEANAAGVWAQQARLAAPASDSASDTCFGVSVAVTFDGVLVGQPCDGEQGGVTTHLYVFAKDTHGKWAQRAALTSPAGADMPNFAQSIATNGFSAVIGSPVEQHNLGAAYALNCLPCLALPNNGE